MQFHAFTTSKIEDKNKPRYVPWILEHQSLTETNDGPETNLVSYIMRNLIKASGEKNQRAEKQLQQRRKIILVQTKQGQHEELLLILSRIDEFTKGNEVRIYRMEKNFQPSADVNKSSSGTFGADMTASKSGSRAREDHFDATASATPLSDLDSDIPKRHSPLCFKCLAQLKNFILEYDEAERARRSWPSSKQGNELEKGMCPLCARSFYEEITHGEGTNHSMRISRSLRNPREKDRLIWSGNQAKEASKNCLFCSGDTHLKDKASQRCARNLTLHGKKPKSSCSCEAKPFMCTKCFLNSLIANGENNYIGLEQGADHTNVISSEREDFRPGSAPARLQYYKPKMERKNPKYLAGSTIGSITKTIENAQERKVVAEPKSEKYSRSEHRSNRRSTDNSGIFDMQIENSLHDNAENIQDKESRTLTEEGDRRDDTEASKVSFEDSLEELLTRLAKRSSRVSERAENEEIDYPLIGKVGDGSELQIETEPNIKSFVSDGIRNERLNRIDDSKSELKSLETIEPSPKIHPQSYDGVLIKTPSRRERKDVEAPSQEDKASKPLTNGHSDENHYNYEIFDQLGKEADLHKVRSPRNKGIDSLKKGENDKNGQHFCKFCPEKMFTSGHVWKIHMKNKHKKCNCPCGQYFETREDYLKHFYGIFPLACFVERKCPERFRSLYFQAVHHRDKHLCDRPFFCVLCFGNDEDPEIKRRASFKDMKSLRIHAESIGHDPNEMFLISSKSEIDHSSLPWSMKCSGIDFC
ncbi:uncharacterized protein LOC135689944 [Rhopilema esculentum]|uniref:uncharacterized protein LOC135689944 n=1 Tax=Rhopilema esculentum TaxID=499914 RepID=UPI0031DF9281|eukprot:gene8484-14480_t